MESSLRDFLQFRRMIMPVLIQIIYWIASFAAVVYGLYLLFSGEGMEGRLTGLAFLIFGPLALRLYAEVLLVIFRINDTLTDIRNQNAQNRQ